MEKKYFYVRSTGFYWCKVKSNNSLEVCYWNGRYWELTGNENHFEDKELIINEEVIKRPLAYFSKNIQ